MTVQLPPSAPPGLAQTLAEAALQRQSFLLAPAREGTAASESSAPTAAGTPANTPANLPPGSVANAAPQRVSEQVSVSAQARAQIEADQAMGGGARQAPGMASTGVGLSARAQTAMLAGTGASLTPGTSGTSGATRLQAAAAAQWPASGVAAGLRGLLQAAVAQLTAQAQQPQRVTAAQPWPAALLPQAQGGKIAGSPALQTWLVGQGTVLTDQGGRNFTLTLQAPSAWVQAQPQITQAQNAPGAPLLLRMEGRAEALQSGTWALVLQSSAGPAGGARASALLTLEFAPQLPATVYGREMLMVRNDPWLHMAALQASGQRPRDDDAARERDEPICATAGCPYAGRAPCEQPFCLALRTVVPTQALEPPTGTAPGA
jgi:hypothetical protein